MKTPIVIQVSLFEYSIPTNASTVKVVKTVEPPVWTCFYTTKFKIILGQIMAWALILIKYPSQSMVMCFTENLSLPHDLTIGSICPCAIILGLKLPYFIKFLKKKLLSY